MSSYTYRIKGARWLRMYTAEAETPVYAAESDAQTVADALCDVPWTRAGSDGPAMFPQHNGNLLDENVGNRDLFDAAAFCANHKDGAHRVYANAAMYLFSLPPAAQGVGLSSVKVHVESDPYNEFGVRVAVHLLSTPELPTECGTVRTGVAHADGQVPRVTQSRNGTDYWYANGGDVTVEMPANTQTTAYLAVFVGLENYARSRGEWIEGASYIRNSVVIETTGEIVGWDGDGVVDASGDPSREFAVVRGGVVPMLPEGSASGVRKIELFRTGDEIVPSFTDSASDPAYTVVEFDGHATEFLGQAADVNVSIPFTLDGATTRIVAVCGAFERASIPGVPGLVLIDAATGAILQATASGALDATLAALLNTAASKVGVTIDTSGTDPTALVYAASATQFSGNAFISLNLSTLVASDAGMSASALSFASNETPVRFFDRSLLLEFLPSDPQVALVPLFCTWSYPATGDESRTVLQLFWTPASCWTARKGSTKPTSQLSVAAYGADPRIDWIGATGDGNFWTDNTAARRSLTVVGSYEGLGRTEAVNSGGEVPVPTVVLDECTTGFVRVDMSASSGSYPRANATATALDPGMAAGPLVRLEQEEYGGTKYLAFGGFYQAGGDAELRYALEYDAELGTRTALGASCAPYAAFALGGKFGVARARLGSARQDYFFAEDLPAAPTAANSAIGLRTLQGKFYLGQAEAVARATRARIGAAYSVRAGTRTLKVVTAGAAADTAVPVWRLFASALAVPFAVPTEWRARALRLDWTDWAGTATAGARFNVWIRAGHWQDASPQALEGDAPYDALAAEADGWTLLGTVDATLAGVARTAEFAVGEKIASAKVASLMLTAYAPTDGINPADGTTWPVGAGTEVDLSGGEVANAGKAWLPDVTLIG